MFEEIVTFINVQNTYHSYHPFTSTSLLWLMIDAINNNVNNKLIAVHLLYRFVDQSLRPFAYGVGWLFLRLAGIVSSRLFLIMSSWLSMAGPSLQYDCPLFTRTRINSCTPFFIRIPRHTHTRTV